MSLLLSPMAKNSSAGFYNGAVSSSLRMQNGRLTRTPSATGNPKKWTFSAWIKRGTLGQSYIFAGSPLAAGYDGLAAIYFDGTDQLHTYYDTSGANPYGAVGPRLYRDTSSWYHLVWAVDAANTIHKIWINNELVSTDTGKYPPNVNYGMNNSGDEMVIGDGSWDSYGSADFNGYMAEINYLDNQYLEPDAFAETKNGIWIPLKDPSLTYGTNGFRLQFDQVGVGTASTSTIGADTSGNTHHFTSSGIVASDCALPDSPENNFATWNEVDAKGSAATMAEGNLKVTSGGNSYDNIPSTFMMSSGKWYWEVTGNTYSAAICGVDGIGWGGSVSGTGSNAIGYWTTGPLYYDGGNVQGGASYATSDVLAVSVDMDSGIAKFYKNNSEQYSVTFGESGIPDLSAGAFPIRNGSTTGSYTIANFGQDSSFAGTETAQGNTDSNGIGDFYYEPPSGFLALCTANLPEPTIGANSDTQADDHFNTILYTGNGQTGLANSGVGFQPDFVWLKNRTGTAYYHQIYDSTRGATKALYTAVSNAEDTISGLTAFGSDGFTVGNSATANNNGVSTVAWNWKANGGTTVTNEAGSIDSAVQANTDAGFSIVNWSGNATSGATVGHGLTVAPEMTIGRRTNDATSWHVYHTAMDAANNGQAYMYLDATTVVRTSTEFFTAKPSSSVVTLGDYATMNGNNDTIIMYAFHSVEGYSKFGKYTGNGSADGPFVYTGFRPAWVMIKRTDTVNNWMMSDSVRDIDNVVTELLYANLANAAYALLHLDFTSNGFKVRATNASWNASGGTYIYMVFAESSFKYANAR